MCPFFSWGEGVGGFGTACDLQPCGCICFSSSVYTREMQLIFFCLFLLDRSVGLGLHAVIAKVIYKRLQCRSLVFWTMLIQSCLLLDASPVERQKSTSIVLLLLNVRFNNLPTNVSQAECSIWSSSFLLQLYFIFDEYRDLFHKVQQLIWWNILPFNLKTVISTFVIGQRSWNIFWSS